MPYAAPDTPTERLPVYEAVLSQWFEAPADNGTTPRHQQPEQGSENGAEDTTVAERVTENGAEETTVTEQPPETSINGWTSPGDEGWQAAQALLDNTPESETQNGLPKRVPKAHLVPGSAAPRHAATAAESSPTAPPMPPRSAEAVRHRMSSFQQGVRRGRHALVDAHTGDQSGSEDSRKDEEQQ
jgi:hypothetical protein